MMAQAANPFLPIQPSELTESDDRSGRRGALVRPGPHHDWYLYLADVWLLLPTLFAWASTIV